MLAQPPAPNVLPATAPITHVACVPAHARERCGFVSVPLDRRHPNGRRIRIYFEQYLRRQTARPRLSTVVSIEGGPGYSTTSDRANRLEVWRPVNARRDLVLIDLRGTGRSHAILCPAFKNHDTQYIARAGRCAQQLGPNRDFYDTAQSVKDMQAVLLALRAGKVDMYGDSYGSYAAQAFALRYPGRLRSLVLDGTYPLPSSDAELRDIATASRRAFRLVCRRGPNCPVKGSDPVAVLHRFIQQVRANPITGKTHDGDGAPVSVTVNEDSLVQTVMDAEAVPAVYRDLLGAILSAEHGDNAPLLRVVAENITVDSPNGPRRDFSEALYAAVICHDYPQPWSATTPIPGRLSEALARIDARPPAQFAPFSARAWTGTDYEGALACARWPAPAFPDPPAPPHARYPNVPTLILNGDLDNITPLEDARVVARRFPNSRLVDVFNSVHVTVLADQNECASVLYERFVRSLSPGNTTCAARVPEVRVVRRYPLSLSDVPGAVSTTGDRSTLVQRRMSAAAADTVADVISDWWVNYSGVGVGLRGGTWSYTGANHTVFHLASTRLVPGVAVTGRVDYIVNTGAVAATVTVRSAGTAQRIHMTWSLNQRLGRAAITGSGGGRVLRLRMLAP